MKHTSLTLIAVIIGICCCSNCGRNRNSQIVEENLTEKPDPFAGVFRSKALQDSLDKFMNAIDSIPNPFGPTIYTVACTYNDVKKETDIVLTAEGVILTYGVLLANFNFNFKEDKLRILGARKVNGHIIAVCCYDVDEPEKIFNLDVLDKKLYYEHDYAPDESLCDIVRPSVRHYRLIGRDSLKVIHIGKSRYEK